MERHSNGQDDRKSVQAAIHAGVETRLVTHDETVVYESDDTTNFVVIDAQVSPEPSQGEPQEESSTTYHVQFAQIRGGQPSAVCVARRSDGKLLLVLHWRIATQTFEWEFPRSVGLEGETIIGTARRELRAEVGLEADTVEIMQTMHANTSKLRDSIAIVDMSVQDAEAMSADEGTYCSDGGAEVKFMWRDAAQIDAMIQAGSIMDGITLAAYAVHRVYERLR